MPDNQWDDQFRSFLNRARTDLRRMTQDIRDEAQKLVAQVQDPKNQQKVREGLREVSQWARRAAEDVAEFVERGAGRAEHALRNLTRNPDQSGPSTDSSPTAPTPRPVPSGGGRSARQTANKTVGPRKRPAGAAPRKKTSNSQKKTVGRKPRGTTS